MHMRALIIKNERIQTLHRTNEIKSLAFIEISSNKNVAKLREKLLLGNYLFEGLKMSKNKPWSPSQ